MKFFLLSLFFFPGLYASEIVTIVASDSIPPYVMGSEPLAKELPGLQVEIVDAVFAKIGITTKWKTMPNHRLGIQYKLKHVDAALNLPDVTNADTHSSADLITYRNCVIGPSKFRSTWKTQASKLKILGFQTAKHVFNEVFGNDVLARNKNYNEVTSQKTIAYHAVHGRADLVLSDALVFDYYAQTYFGPQYQQADLMCLYELQIARHLGFKDRMLRDRFDAALVQIKKDGTYDALVKKYREKFSLITQLESSNRVKTLPIAQN